MTATDQQMMERAIAQAEQCQPREDRIPKVGAIISIGDAIIGQGHRGTGMDGDDDHAELVALRGVVDRTQLPRATIYTTLEPCTAEVRSDPLTCCTELISKAEVAKVFIGILDPNQGVRGKGLWELQDRGIDVELFPPDLAKRIRAINEKFIRTQRRLGIRFTDPQPGSVIRTYDNNGIYTFRGDALNEPGDDVVIMTRIGGRWWPQRSRLNVDPASKPSKFKWSADVDFGSYEPHSIYIMRANDLGMAIVNYYLKITQQNWDREKMLRGNVKFQGDSEESFLRSLPGIFPPINMPRLLKGLEFQAKIDVKVEAPPNAK